jgi:hypothetical protein|tara:strand:- start:145 stop:429 length:285 start_codon:yes stop_codon:yes gene_type:complete
VFLKEKAMLKSNDIKSYWEIDRMYDGNCESIEYFRLKMNGDIQIWKTYSDKSGRWGMYEVVDTSNGNSRLYTRFADALAMGLLYHLQAKGLIAA